MVVAMFLTKDLLIDWRWGEKYFATKLVDYDPASNNGGWQWSSSTGTDAQPYFRIFSPELQTKKYDKNLEYITKWNPHYKDIVPIVDHKERAKLAIATFKQI
jgi:deoxyribodipyrimidine photo-lyase